MFRGFLDIYIIQDFSLWFYNFLGVAFNFTMNLYSNFFKIAIKIFDKVLSGVINYFSKQEEAIHFSPSGDRARKVNMVRCIVCWRNVVKLIKSG